MPFPVVDASSKPRMLILGANGLLGRVCYHVFHSAFSLTLCDRSVGAGGKDNRFGLEGVGLEEAKREWGDLNIPESEVRLIDLAKEQPKLEALFEEIHPAIVIHLANILESAPVEVIRLNRTINESVLRMCVAHGVKCIAASSIMVYYGGVLSNPLLSRVMLKDSSAKVEEKDRLTVDSPVVLEEAVLKPYLGENLAQWLEYIRCKEALEALAHQLCGTSPASIAARSLAASSDATPADISASSSSVPTIISVRFGWASIRPAAEIEAEAAGGGADAAEKADSPPVQAAPSASAGKDHATPAVIPLSETSIVLTASDLRSFLSHLVSSLLTEQVTGSRVYTVVSEHRQRWVSLEREKKEIGWQPEPLRHAETMS